MITQTVSLTEHFAGQTLDVKIYSKSLQNQFLIMFFYKFSSS